MARFLIVAALALAVLSTAALACEGGGGWLLPEQLPAGTALEGGGGW